MRSSDSTALFAAGGSALLLSQAALLLATRGLTHASAMSVGAVLPLIAGLGIPAVCALVCAPRLAIVPVNRTTVLLLVAIGFLMRAMWFGAPAPLEDDYFRYLWDGAVVANGFARQCRALARAAR